ncbi:hypothetical protein ABIF65_007772 [Bradyrhizobium japonicum]|uniref:Ribbon-helix-helix protein CopG domain-containing protein n=2 Tax=Bradyrhizobium TaxID=374 RepID=A0A810CKL6_9BRAD|nr:MULTISPECIES: hypothetical protein [Bradyrhizobium]MBR1000527.1 hypothetical protein [Bradyrhizobium liaoningense]MCP1863714.1 hypothetical protein [Bradyrhizobium japonicum]MCW2327685.1 hypothetical protein [Bradyrhizobium japonicum]QLD45914.1 hypothetical protein HUW42_35170 [Bradyrhizobium diazoefficiens]WLA72249.1 hypothetical protein QIH77_35995 [Bradyrhizobium diazoefficiens]
MPRPKSKVKNNAQTKGLRATLLYLHPDTVKALKSAAILEERPAYEVAEQAIKAYLRQHHKSSE